MGVIKDRRAMTIFVEAQHNVFCTFLSERFSARVHKQRPKKCEEGTKNVLSREGALCINERRSLKFRLDLLNGRSLDSCRHRWETRKREQVAVAAV